MFLILFFIIGVITGILSGMFGIGGGVVMVPTLIYLSGLSQLQACGTSLVALLLPVGILGVIRYYREGLIDISVSLLLALGLFLGAFFGANLAISLPADIMARAYGVFLLIMSWRFLDVRQKEKVLRKITISQKTIVALTGIVSGVLSGLFGIGGGAVIVAVLHNYLGFETKQAIATSLSALLLPVGLPGVFVYYQNGLIDLSFGLILSLGLMIGVLFGSIITISLPRKTVKIAFGLLLLLVSIDFLI